ncbi:hypothetical protein TSMEX_010795 [Taenia solium]|eukprot:TsM_000229100 transcript=TsM_000229100 gene=TsM_000229100
MAPFPPSELSYCSIAIVTTSIHTHTSACARAEILPPFVLLLYMLFSFSHQNDDALLFTLLVLAISLKGKQSGCVCVNAHERITAVVLDSWKHPSWRLRVVLPLFLLPFLLSCVRVCL